MPNRVPQPGAQHPEEWRRDLNPDAMAGQNIGTAGPHPEQGTMSAFDIKDVQRRLADKFSNDELKQIPVLRPGSRLEQNATYIDLSDPTPKEFTAAGREEAYPNNLYVAKSAVNYEVWNKLIGITTPERLGLK